MAKDRKQAQAPIFGDWNFTPANYILFLIGIVIIILAYIIMALGTTNSFQALTLAPIMLIIGYLIIIPLAIVYKSRKHPEKQ